MTEINYTQTFSMQNILNQPLDPNLCRRILDQIKSPLMEQSFILTNDQSFNHSQSNIPKRPLIPYQNTNKYQSSKRPIIKSKYVNHQSFDNQNFNHTSYRSMYTEGKQSPINYRNQHNHNNHNNIISQIQLNNIIVSPLDPNITQQQQNEYSKEESFDIFQLISHQICGNTLNQSQNHQIKLNQSDKIKYRPRRKIFNENIKKISKNPPISILLDLEQKNKSHIQLHEQNRKQLTLKDTLFKLKFNDQPQISNFVQICIYLINELKKTASEIQFCNRNLAVVYSNSTLTSDCLEGVCNIDENTSKALNRMNFKSIPNMLQKFTANNFIKCNNLNLKEYNSLKNKISDSIQIIISCFNEIQRRIQLYVSQPNITQNLQKVFNVLQSKFKFSSTRNLFQQIYNLFKDIHLDQYSKNILSLEYLWPGFQQNLFTQEQFINGILKNYALYRKQINQTQAITQFQTQLARMGYQKN